MTTSALQPAYAFAGYPYYLLPLEGRLWPRKEPLPAGYAVEERDWISLDFAGESMRPTIPPGSSLMGEVVAPDALAKLPPGVYAMLVGDKASGRLRAVVVGRLREPPVKGSLTLWPDNPKGGTAISLGIKVIAFGFRIRWYKPLSEGN